jgi:hypothetical protein
LALVGGAIASALLVGFAGSATADSDPFNDGPLIARGKSPAGVPWRIRATPERGAVTFDFFLKPPGYPDAGYLTTFQLPISNAFVFTADAGSDLDPAGESDVSGITSARVARVRLRMSDGSVLEFSPRTPPEAVRKRFPWGRRIAAFDYWYDSSLEPELATALDRDGRVLGRFRSHRGLFEPATGS